MFLSMFLGMFQNISEFINFAGIVTNGFIIAFTSQCSEKNFKKIQNKLLCVVIFEVYELLVSLIKYKSFLCSASYSIYYCHDSK